MRINFGCQVGKEEPSFKNEAFGLTNVLRALRNVVFQWVLNLGGGEGVALLKKV
jgi:hypothetical protein